MRILYSRSQAALLDACVAQIDAAHTRWPEQRAILLVPEPIKAEAEQRYFARTGRGGILMAEVLSFSRLAWRVQGEVGGLSHACVDPIGKSILLHTLLKEHRGRLAALAAGAGRPGFAPEVGQVLGDLRRHGVRPQPLREAAAEAQADDRAFAGKAADLAFLMDQYEERLGQLDLQDREDDLWRLADTLERQADTPSAWPLSRLAFMADAHVWVTGFAQTREFTPQEYAVLAGLARVCAQVTITVCADAVPGDDRAIDNGPDAFRIGRATARRLTARFPQAQAAPVLSPVTGVFAQIGRALTGELPPEGEAAGRDAAAPDSSATAAAGGLPAAREPVATLLFRTRDDEIRWVAGHIRHLTQIGGYRYADIAIGVSTPSAYLPSVRAVFREYGLSPFIDEPRPLAGTPLYRFIRALLDLAIYDWSLPAVTACLRADFCQISREEADRLENFLLARGLTGADRVFDNRRYRADFRSLVNLPEDDSPAEMEPDEAEDTRRDRHTAAAAAAGEARMLRDRVLSPLRQFLENLAQEPSCAGKCDLLQAFLTAYGVPEAVEARVATLGAGGEEEAAITLVRAWNGIRQVLEQMRVIAGTSAYDLPAFADALAAGMEGAQSGVIPPVIDRITVSGYTRAGYRHARVLFLLGATDEAFPGSPPPEGLLKDPDRARISARLGVRMPSVLRDQVFAGAALTYGLLTAPTHALYLTAPVGAGPTPTHLELLRAAVPGGWHTDVGAVDVDDARVAALRPARRFLMSLTSHPPGRITRAQWATWRALADVLELVDPSGVGSLWPAWLREDRVHVRLPAARVREAAGTEVRMSISQLERFAACPYAYMAQYLMRLQEREVWSPRSADTGVVLHGVMEWGIRQLCEELAAATSAAEQAAILARWRDLDYEAFARGCMEHIAAREGYAVFFDTGIRASSGRRILRMGAATLQAVVEQLSDENTRPQVVEWRFGGEARSPLVLRVRGAEIAFRGIVDRVDAVDDAADGHTSGAFRVVDYKSGDAKFDPDRVFYGLSLQLPAYAAAWRNAHPGASARELAYLRFQAPFAGPGPHVDPVDEQAIQNEIARCFRLRKTGLEPDGIARVIEHTEGRMRALCGALLAGRADALPARIGSAPAACAYCVYRALCGHDGKQFYHLKPLNRLTATAQARTRAEKLLVAIAARQSGEE